ncbi:Dual specificity protein kinase [Penicillium chermesinum]|uniref:dual-specificity kinase n=1 Tax=Penicillium chermesinum TaxID=63820 RepID=A0A9W9NUY9_9EURO|nr:Dual specificity protein kinase [Penicillium chermesinum]KAJ5226483.1 Dual specificity protein kinase [Penicillium chermesinum]KAJ6160339.1 Dual specificity protein kinase [Penicillium chermesinum]
MSTPSTATATHPSHQRYGYPHSSYQTTSTYPAPATTTAGARLANSYTYSVPSPTTSTTLPYSQSSRVAPTTSTPSGMVSHQSGSSAAPSQNGRKKQPDWGEFYKNGIPKEVIVIDDSPAPESSNAAPVPPPHATTAGQPPVTQPANKKRRTGIETAYDLGYYDRPSFSINPQRYGENSSHSLSTDRTTSLHTTAPTSLGSQGSAGVSNTAVYEDPSVGQKRKRTTRKSARDEQKRRDLETGGDAFLSYVPPPHPIIKAKDVPVPVIRDMAGPRHEKFDDDDGHYLVTPDTPLTDRYSIIKLLGQGTFGKVVEAYDKQRKSRCAVKIIRSIPKYRDASRIELRVLSTLASNDKSNRNKCIHLRDCFDFRNHICIVTDLLGQSVFDFLKGNGFVPFPSSQIQHFARQLFTSVAFLHDLNLIHTDLKPENILLVSNAYQTFTYNRTIPSSSHANPRNARQRRVLLDSEIRLIDFGSATFDDEYHSSVVSTRHYRAPEIILNLGWSFPCDIWSIGCILVEFFTGDALFQTHDNLEHLAMMEAVIGHKLDQRIVKQVTQGRTGNHNSASKYFVRNKLDYPNNETTRASRKYVRAMKEINEFIPTNSNFNRQFLDLLRQIFVYDPKQRITAKEALKHPWFKESLIDDGTEAYRIGMGLHRQGR